MTTKKNVLLTLMFLLTTIQVSAQDMNSTVNTMLDGWARPIYLAGMLIGLIAGLVRNYDNIAAKNDNGNRMDGVIAVVWMVGCLLYTSPSPRDRTRSRMPSSA